MLAPYFINDGLLEAGCDEAGRGALVGGVYAAAVIWDPEIALPGINDSKQLTKHQRNKLRTLIEQEAIAWAVGVATQEEIDRINILHASFLAMHRAIQALQQIPDRLLIDGNRFTPYPSIPHRCIVKGDATLLPIAAASILAKTHRDEYMDRLAIEYPQYGWEHNAGYPTKEHRAAIARYGLTQYHRKSFRCLPEENLFVEKDSVKGV
ncbi:ribonuclease HII [Porphyromonas miyakawae]|uniref:Ribonuclease HII n=1 Tax=Porphyromonas miyakawae TaxID=3137470 RepID=A0ABQ0E1R3_9PORP